ncbi:MAG TPA: type II toxin-antitoxin system prevent-host-death family antitoxin [Acidobacteriota bacterium]|nr:type II toxin-antitoxin system prevent-host-death family antitoxin [Acidobacteriota bacterium]
MSFLAFSLVSTNQVDIAEARAHLAALLDKAIQGNEILITWDDKPLVKLSPVMTEPLTFFVQFKCLHPWILIIN